MLCQCLRRVRVYRTRRVVIPVLRSTVCCHAAVTTLALPLILRVPVAAALRLALHWQLALSLRPGLAPARARAWPGLSGTLTHSKARLSLSDVPRTGRTRMPVLLTKLQ